MKITDISITGKKPPQQNTARYIGGVRTSIRTLRELGSILKETYLGWARGNGSLLAAGLSYYTIFSLTPLLVLAVSVAGMIFSEKAVTAQLVAEVDTVISHQAARAVASVLENNHVVYGRGWAAGVGAAGMLLAASIMFVQLKRAINIMWGLAPHPEKGLFVLVRTHFWSFIMVFMVILLLLGLMVASTLLVTINQRFELLPQVLQGRWPEADFSLTFVGFTLMFAVIFKTLPDARTAWRDVIVGAAATSFLFTGGGYLLGLYLGRVHLYSIYGAASSVFLIMGWVYYSMQILLFGAKLTQVIANRYGSQVIPSSIAARIIHNLEFGGEDLPARINGKVRR